MEIDHDSDIQQIYQYLNDRYIILYRSLEKNELIPLVFSQEQIEQELIKYQQKLFNNEIQQRIFNDQTQVFEPVLKYVQNQQFEYWRTNSQYIVFYEERKDILIYSEVVNNIFNLLQLIISQNPDQKFLSEFSNILDLQLTQDDYLVILTQVQVVVIQLFASQQQRLLLAKIIFQYPVLVKQRVTNKNQYLNDLSNKKLNVIIVNTGSKYVCLGFNLKNSQALQLLWEINCIPYLTENSLYLNEQYAICDDSIIYFQPLYVDSQNMYIQRFQYKIEKAKEHYLFMDYIQIKLIYVDTMTYEPYTVFNPAFKLVAQNVIHFEREDEYDIEPDNHYYNSRFYPIRSKEQIPLQIQKMSNTK